MTRPAADDFSGLLEAAAPADPRPRPPERGRLLARVAASAAAARVHTTRRRADLAPLPLARGVAARMLYEATGTARRAGEPERVRLVELAPGAAWPGPAPTWRREWLLLQGDARIGAAALAPLDFRLDPAGAAAGPVASERGALLYLRESAGAAGEGPACSAESAEAWHDFAPGIRRRVLWSAGGESALLYRARPGAAVPGHRHGHDEECLMIEGDVFLDDVLLRAGDWQLAPAGSGHTGVATDTGGLLYAHGDLQLDLR